jgi:prefoldin subunit 5
VDEQTRRSVLTHLDLKNAKGMWAWLKEHDAPGEYVYAIRNLIETVSDLDEENGKLSDQRDELQSEVEDLRHRMRQYDALMDDIRSASDDLAEVSQAIQKLV